MRASAAVEKQYKTVMGKARERRIAYMQIQYYRRTGK